MKLYDYKIVVEEWTDREFGLQRNHAVLCFELNVRVYFRIIGKTFSISEVSSASGREMYHFLPALLFSCVNNCCDPSSSVKQNGHT